MLLEKIVFPETLDTIGEYCFLGCRYLKEAIIPNSVTCIYQLAFSQCESLEKVVISSHKTIIDWEVFGDCNKLKEISVPNGWGAIAEGNTINNNDHIETINLVGKFKSLCNEVGRRKKEIEL